MKTLFIYFPWFALAIGSPAIAGPDLAPANPLSASVKELYAFLKNSLVKSGERMPGEDFSFRPTPEIRNFGEILGHVANQNYRSCAAAGGEVNPNHVNIEREKTSKADVVKALQEFAWRASTPPGNRSVRASLPADSE